MGFPRSLICWLVATKSEFTTSFILCIYSYIKWSRIKLMRGNDPGSTMQDTFIHPGVYVSDLKLLPSSVPSVK